MIALLAQIDPWTVIPQGGAVGAVIFCIWLNNRDRREERREYIAALDRQTEAFQTLAERIGDLTLKFEVGMAQASNQPKGGR